jgi:hypothetical protein
MPFLIKPFVAKLQTRLDPESSTYEGPTEGDTPPGEPVQGQLVTQPPPSPPEKWATVWSEATALGAAGLIPPNTMIELGKAAQKNVLLGCTSSTPKYAVLKNSFTTFASIILPGFQPIATAAPPPGAPAFEQLDSVGMGSTVNKAWLEHCGNLINSWFLKGTMIYNAGPTPMMWL